jgi:AmiR/NasT family two-component response regulator
MALDYAREVSNLKQAIESRQLIGQAVGMVMERYGMDEARSFALLSRLSQEQNVKLRDLARQMVDERASQD